MPPHLGCCSWSLKAEHPTDLAQKISAVGTTATQLALRPIREARWDLNQTVAALSERGIEIRSTMMEPVDEDYSTLDSIRETGGFRRDSHWDANRTAARADAKLSRQLGVDLVTFHAGFLPHDRDDPERPKLIARLREVVDIFAEEGVRVGFETGQETAETLLAVMQEIDRPGAGVNFDPANMILYGMGDPLDAIDQLAGWVRQIHIKDAIAAAVPNTWGTEVTVGTGEVDWSAFFAIVQRHELDVDFMIEREAGDARVADMIVARQMVESMVDVVEPPS